MHALVCSPILDAHFSSSQSRPRMRRYFAPKKGKTSASKEALAMFNDKNKRSMIAKECSVQYARTSSFTHVCVHVSLSKSHLLWPTGGTGDKLGEILKAEGFDFQAMEVRVRLMVSESEKTATLGGWHSAISLKNLGWTECLPQ